MCGVFCDCPCTQIMLFIPALIVYIVVRRLIPRGKRVCVVVLGDIGRSPRMQYHSLSLAGCQWPVDFVGYGGSVPHKDVTNNSHITIHHLAEPPTVLQKFPRLMMYVLKVLWQCVTMAWVMLFRCSKPSHYLIQTPPAIPSLAVVWFLSMIQGSKLVVDWHNYGYSIMALSMSARHPLVRFSMWYEKLFGRFSKHNICVTQAMKKDLLENWNIRAETVYDRPPKIFKETSLEEQHTLFKKLVPKYNIFQSSSGNKEETAFTEKTSQSDVVKRNNRPALVVSSTSWTPDEDFSILLTALGKYEEAVTEFSRSDLPDIICAITGKGPQKEYYCKKIETKNWKHIKVCTPWLEAEDYPKLLGSADIGVCLHKSSSGLDLPMKVVDMFGCALPVCAVHFNCLHELVKNEENGKVFHDENELAAQLQELLTGFPGKCDQLQKFRQNLKKFQNTRWDDEWKKTVQPLFS